MPREMEDDYYAVLGLGIDVDEDEIRRTWRRLALTWHPDRAGPGTTHAFARMSVAYAVISDPASRAAYDKRRGIDRSAKPASSDRGSSPTMRSDDARTTGTYDRASSDRTTNRTSSDHASTSDRTTNRTSSDHASTRDRTTNRTSSEHASTSDRTTNRTSSDRAGDNADIGIGKRAPGVLLTRISGPLNILMARGVVREHGDNYELLLDDEEARDGGMVTISMRVLVKCPTCEGTGIVAADTRAGRSEREDTRAGRSEREDTRAGRSEREDTRAGERVRPAAASASSKICSRRGSPFGQASRMAPCSSPRRSCPTC